MKQQRVKSSQLDGEIAVLECVVRQHYPNRTLSDNEIGVILGYDRQTITQIRKRAYRKLRSHLRHSLREFGTDPKTLMRV